MYKLFIGGTPLQTTKQDLMDHFRAFGSIASVIIVTDRKSRRPVGYAFINCSDYTTADKILQQRYHHILGRMVEVNLQCKNSKEKAIATETKKKRKIYVSNLAASTTSAQLAQYFSYYGPVANAYIIFDKHTGLSKSTSLLI
jgi:RNA recognition motif-containing protein